MSTGGAGTGGNSVIGSSGLASTGGVPGSSSTGSGAGGTTSSSGGTSSAGGTSSTGGVFSTGGVMGIGGTGGSGGNTGTGGAMGTGGRVTGTGGATGIGGTRGSGGVASTGGAMGTGGAKGGATGTGGTGTGGKISSTGGATGIGGTSGSGGTTGPDGSSSACPPATPLTGGTKYCSNTKAKSGSYSYELWADGGGSGCMTIYGVNATFSATWTNVGDFLARMGLLFDQTKTPTQIGTISADFAETKTSDSGLVYVGIYGWTVSPLREYYIIDDWGSTKPAGVASDGSARTHIGTITVDGDDYDVWKNTRVNKPNITGTDATFDQYFSVRTTARQCGHISISQHFSEWTKLGLQLGNLEEAELLLEAQNGTGTIDVTTATVVVK